MLSTMKNKARDLGLEPYLETPYQYFVKKPFKKPYWVLRRRLYPKTNQTVAGVDVQFVAKTTEDVEYHEFQSESPIIKDIIQEIGENDVFFDIGANIGLYSSVITKKIGSENVVAFEPAPPAYRKLESNSKLNGGFIHHQIAVSNKDEMIDLAVDVSDTQARMSTLDTDNELTNHTICEVPSRKLTTIIEDESIPSPTIVKIDVEGAEFKVLDGMEELLDSVRIVYCEIHHPNLDSFDTNGSEIFSYLESFGFNIQTLHQRDGNEFVKASKTI